MSCRCEQSPKNQNTPPPEMTTNLTVAISEISASLRKLENTADQRRVIDFVCDTFRLKLGHQNGY